MSLYLPFEESFNYPDHNDGIVIPATLKSGPRIHITSAVVDCGGGVCLFSREVGDLLGLDIEQGEYKRLRTLTGGLDSFGHEVSVKALNIVLDSTIYFAREKGLPRNILGRQGWLRKLRFGLVEYDNLIYLGRHDA
ncbi:MAG: hypothetical protein ABI977_16390 [Acidobacteriota bacterium]